MGKIIFEFDSVEESQDARVALDGYKWKMAMWDLDQMLRSTVKHGVGILDSTKNQATDTEIEVADKLREEIRGILNDYGLNLED
jgi:hypothetical protein